MSTTPPATATPADIARVADSLRRGDPHPSEPAVTFCGVPVRARLRWLTPLATFSAEQAAEAFRRAGREVPPPGVSATRWLDPKASFHSDVYTLTRGC